MGTATFDRLTRTFANILLLTLGPWGCVYQPLAVTTPPGLGDNSGTTSGDSDNLPTDTTQGDSVNPSGDPAQPSCGELTITGSSTIWVVSTGLGTNVVIPRQSNTSEITLTASAADCAMSWSVDSNFICGVDRPAPCYTPTSEIPSARWSQTTGAPVVETQTAVVTVTPAVGNPVPHALTLTFLPTLEARSSFVSVASSQTGSGKTPLDPGTLASAAALYTESLEDSFGVYFQHGSVSAPDGFQAQPGTLLIGSFSDLWAYAPCPHTCPGASAFAWGADGPTWRSDLLYCESYSAATFWVTATTTNGVISFLLDGTKSTAPTGAIALVVKAVSTSNELSALIDVVVQGQSLVAPFVARELFLLSKDSVAVPLRLGRAPSTIGLTVQLNRVTAVSAGTDGSGASRSIVLNTHLGSGSTIDRSCLDISDAQPSGTSVTGDGAAVLWESTALADTTSASENLTITDSAIAISGPRYASACGLSVAGPQAAYSHLGVVRIIDSSIAAVGGGNVWGITASTLAAIDVTGTQVHAQHVTNFAGSAKPIQVLDLRCTTKTEMHFDSDVLCTHMPDNAYGNTEGLKVVLDGATASGTDLFVRNTFINAPTKCGSPDNFTTGNTTGIYVDGPAGNASIEVGGSLICAGSLRGSIQAGILVSSMRANLHDNIVGGSACGGFATTGTAVSSTCGVQLSSPSSGSLVERNWIDSGLLASLSTDSTLEAAILLTGEARVRVVSNVLSASKQVFRTTTPLTFSELDVGDNTALVSIFGEVGNNLIGAWGIETDTSLRLGAIHDNLVSLPSFSASLSILASSLPSALAYNTYLIREATVDPNNDGANSNFIILDPMTAPSSVFCVPAGRLVFDPHLSSAAANVGDKSIRGINPNNTNAPPNDIDNDPRGADLTAPNNFRGADAEADDGCPEGGRPTVPPTVDATTPP